MSKKKRAAKRTPDTASPPTPPAAKKARADAPKVEVPQANQPAEGVSPDPKWDNVLFRPSDSPDAVEDGVFIEAEAEPLPYESQVHKAKIGQPIDDKQPQDAFMHWLVHPMPLEKFHSEHFENKPFVLSRNRPEYNLPWLTIKKVRGLIETNQLKWGMDFTVHRVVKGEDGKPFRKDFGLEKKGEVADGKEVLHLFDKESCSIRFLGPQHLDKDMKRATDLFEAYWSNFAGNNLYYTPKAKNAKAKPGKKNAGFAPHWDDVDAWLIQAEGAKIWSLWCPPEGCELPRHYSIDFQKEDLGDPDYTFELSAGDLLYIPRGWIHAGITKDQDSLHMTLSSYYRHSWADLLRAFTMNAIRDMEQSDFRLRQGLPRDLYRVMGSTRELEVSPFEHWPLAPDTLASEGVAGYRKVIAKQALEGKYSLGRTLPEASKSELKSANQARKANKAAAQKARSAPPPTNDLCDDELEALRPLMKRRTRIGAYTRGLLLEMLGVEAPIEENMENEAGYERAQTLPLDETVDVLASDFWRRRLPPQAAGELELPEEESGDKYAEDLLCEEDLVRLKHPEVCYPMFKPKPEHDDPPKAKDADEQEDGETFMLIHHVNNADCMENNGNLELSVPIILPLRALCTIKHLQDAWPNPVPISHLPMIAEDDEGGNTAPTKTSMADGAEDVQSALNDDKVMLATELYKFGVLEKM